MNRDEYVSKAELAREKQRTDKANRGLVSVVQHLMKQLGAAEVRLPIAELDEEHRVSIVADGDTLVVSLRPVPDRH